MTTAVIISGVMRNMINASSSWLIDADYYLITENKIYNPQSTDQCGETVIDTISNVIDKSSVTFSSVNILMDEELKLSVKQLRSNPEFSYHPVIAMAFKWKYAYNILNSVQHTKQYNKILLWRPDIYIRYASPIKKFNKQLPAPGHIHGIGKLETDIARGYFVTGDTCLMLDWESFKILSGFFDYFIMFYNETILNSHDVHSLLARYLIERSVTIDDLLHSYLDYAILRDNSNSMFTNGMLNREYSFEDLRTRQNKWWKENINNG